MGYIKKNVELKPCPFCGGVAELIYAPGNMDAKLLCFGVACKNCDTMIGTVENGKTDFFRTESEARERWNRRVGDNDQIS